jgi:hypothetical protein
MLYTIIAALFVGIVLSLCKNFTQHLKLKQIEIEIDELFGDIEVTRDLAKEQGIDSSPYDYMIIKLKTSIYKHFKF